VWVAELLDSPGGTNDSQQTRAFLDSVYRQLLGRPADPAGAEEFESAMAHGMSRTDVVLSLAVSEEYRLRCRLHTDVARSGGGPRDRRPESYRYLPQPGLWTFELQDAEDFDWLEEAILTDGYYEQIGVWGLEVDLDKRVMAEMVASLSRARVLELGCASGAVLEGLHDYGIDYEGVDISRMAIERASDRVRGRIHHGDVLTLDIAGGFDTVFGLDIFEHLNPNRLDTYIARLASLLKPAGLLFANIPAFGNDEIFGEPFPFYLPGSEQDAEAGRPFSTIQVDDAGYPVHGHLIWADTRWWVRQFESAGFVRRPAIEMALHIKYDEYLLSDAPARRSLYVFSLGDCTDEQTLVRGIEDTPSRALASWLPSVRSP
jgi:hypothetical protein